jgi:hypothetical protein
MLKARLPSQSKAVKKHTYYPATGVELGVPTKAKETWNENLSDVEILPASRIRRAEYPEYLDQKILHLPKLTKPQP